MRKFEKKRNKNFAGIQFENWPIERISIPLSFPSYFSITNRSTLRFERRKEEKTERNEINRESLLFSVKTILQKKEHASSRCNFEGGREGSEGSMLSVNLRDVSYENARATVIWVATSRARHAKVRREERTQRGWRNRDPPRGRSRPQK